MLTLFVLQGPDKGRRFDVPTDEAVSLGRSSEHVPLSDVTVSRRHAHLEHTRDGWMLWEDGSSNGVFINGVKVTKAAKVKLGDQIRMGSTLLVFGSPNQAVTVSSNSAVDVKGATQPGDSAIISVTSSDDSVVLAAPEPSAAAMAHFRVLLQVSTALSAIFDVDQILNKVMDIVFDQLRADRGFIAIIEDREGRKVNPRVVRYKDEDQVGKIAVSQTIIQHVVSRKEGVLSSDAMTDQRFSKGKSVHNLAIRSAICVPIPARDHIIGVIDIDSLVANFSYTTDQLRLLTAIGQLTGIAIENTRLYQENVHRERLAAAGETVASLSHSIKNILQGMRGGADVVELALKKNSLEDAKAGWKLLERNLDKVGALTMNMLAFSKERKPTLEMTHLPHILNECMELVKNAAADRRVTILPEISTTQPPIPVDPDAVHQAVLNLLVNAIEAVEPRRGTGTLTGVGATGNPGAGGVVTLSSAFDPVSQMAVIEVQDNGVGIAEKDQQRIFEPFFSTKGQRGTGLGLAVTKKIVEEHKGVIELISKVGQGTTFRLKFPLNGGLKADQTHAPLNGLNQ